MAGKKLGSILSKVPPAVINTPEEENNNPLNIALSMQSAEKSVVVTLKVPVFIKKEIKKKAFELEITEKELIMMAIKNFGIDIPSKFIVDGRKKN